MNNEYYEIRGNYIQKKVTDFFIFYMPKFNYKDFYDKKDKIIFIEKEPNNPLPSNYIPCMFHMNPNSNNFLICFHGNSEDIFTTEKYGLDFRDYFKMNILFVEYPGYSIYNDPNPEPKKLFEDSLIVYDYILKNFHVSDEQIFIFGRSLGTSPAIYLSSMRKPKALILVSSFTSMKDLGADKHVSYLIEQIFNSITYIKKVACHVLFLHGDKDTFITKDHSIKLLDELKKYNKLDCYLKGIPNMTHDISNIYDIINPINIFLEKKKNENFKLNINQKELEKLLTIPPSIYRIIESKVFNIKDFTISDKKIKKKKAFLLIRLLDERIALSNGSKISIINERHYKDDYEIDISQEIDKNEDINLDINFMVQLKSGNLICTTQYGLIFIFKIDIEDYEKINYKDLNDVIYKIEVLNSNKICLLLGKNIKIYDENLNEVYFSDINTNYINFIGIDDCLVFLSDKRLFYFKLQNNDKELKLFTSCQLSTQCNAYTLVNSYKNLILGCKNTIYYIELKENQLQEPKEINCDLYYENIIFIHKIHDQLFLASTDGGNILQIKINENNDIEVTKKYFNIDYKNVQIKSLLFKSLKNILITCNDKMCILYNSKDQSCLIF